MLGKPEPRKINDPHPQQCTVFGHVGFTAAKRIGQSISCLGAKTAKIAAARRNPANCTFVARDFFGHTIIRASTCKFAVHGTLYVRKKGSQL